MIRSALAKGMSVAYIDYEYNIEVDMAVDPDIAFCEKHDDNLYMVDAVDPKHKDLWVVVKVKGEMGFTAYYGLNEKRELFIVDPVRIFAQRNKYKTYMIIEELPPHLVDGQILETMEKAMGLNEC